MSGINQSQADNVNKYTFGKALRAILRQDPNIIMVGEVRDGETASLALEAALTGHLVLSTLHTNDATSAFGRLIDMGCQPFLIYTAIRAVLAQRLVRVLCPKCKEKYQAESWELSSLGLEEEEVFFCRPVGCSYCNESGYKGRTGIFELFVLDKKIRGKIDNKMDSHTLRSIAIENGMKTLHDDGIRKLKEGLTSVTEILKATTEW
ncbi:MAG: Type II secretion system protein E [candidate division WS2 bacterium]|nr:Type II secretion system protein E [Candidatus Psychracetigena formicireducens]